jgi:D-3-phosphoglycerate dehydrogenase
MSETVDNLILDLLEWIGPGQRPYAETLEAWRTSCPRLPVWEDATDLGFIDRHHEPGQPALVSLSAAGAEHLRKRRPVTDVGSPGTVQRRPTPLDHECVVRRVFRLDRAAEE